MLRRKNFMEQFINLDESYFLEAAELYKDSFAGEPWNDDWSNKEQLHQYIREVSGAYNALNYGLLVDGKLVAISLGGIRHWWEGANYNIDEFCVSKSMRGKGIGSRFMSMIEKDLQTKGIPGIFLQTDIDKPSFRFYTKNGFTNLEKHVSLFKIAGLHIKTERLELVPQGLRFFKTTHEYASDKENMRFTVNLPSDSEEATKEFLEVAENEWKKENPSFFEFAILCNKEHIGGISIYLDESKTCGELGWCLSKKFQGKAYAFEAAKALVQWAQKELSLNHFIAHCDSENTASWKTMEKLGMQRISCTGGRFNKIAPKEERKEFLYEMKI